MGTTFATTFGSGFEDPRFAMLAQKIEVPERLDLLPRSEFYASDELQLFLAVLRAARRQKILLLFSSRGYLKPEPLAVALLSFLPRRYRPTVVLYGEMYEPNRGLVGIMERQIIRLADRAIQRYVVYSKAEAESFAHTWGIDPEKLRVCYFYLRKASQTITLPIPPPKEYIFAGGNSFRDYEPLLAAARRLPQYEFVICTTRLARHNDLPPNVKVSWPPLEEYQALMLSAALVVVPIQTGLRRSAGMLTYLEAMWYKKPVIVSDAMGAREYIADGESGLIVSGTPESYVQSICWMLDAANQERVRRMAEQAHQTVVERFTLENHISQLLEVMDEVTSAQGQA
jgi:glycosyltransferase involved in cell wall biosynthesis